jgi:hypothetical protein
MNLLEIFVVEQRLMTCAYLPSLIIYLITRLIERNIASSNWFKKYLILFGILTVFTVAGVFITYHVVLVTLLPFLFATLYSSKRVMWYVNVTTVISTVIIVYGGYYFGLCDANMALLTAKSIASYTGENGQFILTQMNQNPIMSLMLFFVIPRCLIYWAYMVVCNNIYRIISGSVERVRLAEELEIAKKRSRRGKPCEITISCAYVARNQNSD